MKKKVLSLLLPLVIILSTPFYAQEKQVKKSFNQTAIEQPVAAQKQSLPENPVVDPVKATLIAEQESIQPGKPFWVGVELKMAKGWDTYWINPGDSGFPTQVKWQLPDGFQAEALLWPYPQKFINDSLVAFGYTDSVLLMAKITPPQTMTGKNKIDIGADVTWLACKDSCVPGNATLSLSLPVTKEAPKNNAKNVALFEKTREAHPKVISENEGKVTVHVQKEDIVLKFKPSVGSFGEIEDLSFIPEEQEIIDYAAPQNFKKMQEGVILNLKRAHPEKEAPAQVKGVLLVSEKGSVIKKAIHIDQPAAAASESDQKVTPSAEVSSVAVALALAFIGGLILNVMPCVLPVIALKIFGFVKMANQRRRVLFQHGAIYSLGVLVSFWVLSGALLVLRAYGQGVGWGFQLQEPIFVAILSTILFLLGLSLFGVFELGTSLISLGSKTSSSSSPLGSSFMNGVLATLVATPCTGPLLGPALGFAMTLHPLQSLLIFSSMGLGMASPYLLFSIFPKLVRFLPKPGNWMITFKQVMGFLMMATVVWLVWVFGAQTDNMGTLVLLVSLLVLGIGAWIYGKWSTPEKSKLTRRIALIISLLIMLVGGGTAITTARHHREIPASETVAVTEGWETYSPQRVEELRTQGKAVFVDFTAKWCLICQANKAILHSSDIEKAFKAKGVVTMMADWTKKDTVITAELQKLGRTGVPVYVLYPANKQEAPYILPQTLTSSVIQEYLNK